VEVEAVRAMIIGVKATICSKEEMAELLEVA